MVNLVITDIIYIRKSESELFTIRDIQLEQLICDISQSHIVCVVDIDIHVDDVDMLFLLFFRIEGYVTNAPYLS